MATKLVKTGYGQVELNQVAFRRDGRIEAQCALAEGLDYVENGMLLAVNNMNRTVDFVKSGNIYPIALNYTSEHIYDERTPGLKNFRVEKDGMLPRLGYLATGDKYTTNCVAYEGFDSEEAFLEAVGTTALYAHAGADGYHLVNATATDAIALAVAATTMPDGQKAVKFQAL